MTLPNFFAADEWYYRFVHGTQKDIYSHHYCGYNKHRLIELLKRFGFDKFEDLPNQNFYPSVHLMAYKEEEEEKQAEITFATGGDVTITTGSAGYSAGNVTLASPPSTTTFTNSDGNGIIIDEDGSVTVYGDLHITGKLTV